MANYDNLKTMIDAALNQAGEESSMLLGQALTLSPSDVINTNRTTYFSDMDNAIFVVGVESREDYPGTFYMIFSLADAIVMSGTLLGIPPARISEKRRLCIFEVDDGDAFGEIANQIIGSFNSVLQPKLPNKVHLKLLQPTKFIPEVDQLTDTDPLPDSEYLMLRTQLDIKGQEMKCLDVLIPFSLANLLDPQPDEPEESVVEESTAENRASEEAVETSGTSSGESTGAILIIGDDAQDRQLARTFLSSTGVQLIEAPIGADLQELFGKGTIKLAVVEVKETGDRDLALCSKLIAQSSKPAFPVIMCADQWTRTSVLKAIKNGVTDIILRPYEAEELMVKINKFLKAA